MTHEWNEGLAAPGQSTSAWEQTAWGIGVDVAGPAAADVDRRARFPHEAVDAMREARLFSALLPAEIGGGGASLTEVVGCVRALAAHCASSALVLAMHSIDAFNLVRHGDTPALKEFASEIASGQLLLANANSEVGVGGDAGRSVCALDTASSPWTLDKMAQSVSYGEYADALVATARRGPDASESDQVYLISRRSQHQLEPITEWDTLGLRGTCSRGFRIRAEVSPDDVFPVPFAVVAGDGGGQVRQVLLSAVWVGLAEAAADAAHRYVRAAASKSVGTTPPSALRLAEIAADLHMMRGLLASSVAWMTALESRDDLQNIGLTMELKNLKVSTSTMAVKVATAALGVCGISGYQRESPYSLDRVIRDAHGGAIMVNNDRYLNDNAHLLIARKRL